METFKNFLNESSLSRIKDKIDNHAVGAITAFRGDLTKRENKQRNKKLLAQLMRANMQVTTVKGSYIEDYQTDNAREVGETSFFVANPKEGDDNSELENLLIKLGKQYDQDSIMSVRYGKSAELIGTNNSDFPGLGKHVKVGSGKFGKAGEFFSRVNGRAFKFESLSQIQTIMGKQAVKAIAESAISDIEV